MIACLFVFFFSFIHSFFPVSARIMFVVGLFTVVPFIVHSLEKSREARQEMLGIAKEMAQTTNTTTNHNDNNNNDYNDLHRSKSYDAKLNYDIATPIYSDNDVNNYSHLLSKMNGTGAQQHQNNQSGQTHIIVTSFAPEAKSKANNNASMFATSQAIRPTSHQDGLYYTQEPIVTDKSDQKQL